MRNVVLRAGSSGPLVRDLQDRLNSRLNPSPNLKLNGFFSAQTEQALLAFQRCLRLEPSGIAEQSTLDALFDTEIEAPIQHNLPYIGQMTPSLRWAAAIAMLTQNSVQHVKRMTPPQLLSSNGALKVVGSREERIVLHASVGRTHKLTYLAPQPWAVITLVELLRAGPLVLEFAQSAVDMRRTSGPIGQYFAVAGTRGSHESDGKTTTLYLHDPDESRGRGVQSVLYANLLRRVQYGSFGIFTR